MRERIGHQQKRLVSCALWIAVAFSSASTFAEPGLVQSNLRSLSLEQTTRNATTLRVQNVAGDAGADLLIVRPDANGHSLLEIWERRDLDGSDDFVRATDSPLPPSALDVWGLYVPGGVVGGSRDVAVLGAGATNNLRFFRNRGASAEPRFEPLTAVSVAGATRLHYFPLAPIPPGVPGYRAYPLVATTGGESFWIVRIEDNGSVLPQALTHPGGATHALVLDPPGSLHPMVLTLGAPPALLWQRDAGGTYSSQAVVLNGLVAADRVVEGIAPYITDDAFPELVLALADGRVLRWNGQSGSPIGWGSAQTVASDLQVEDMVEIAVDTTQGRISAALIAADGLGFETNSRLYVTDATLPGRPFRSIWQLLPNARSIAGDIGSTEVFLGQQSPGVLVLQGGDTNGSDAGNSVGWADFAPLPLVTSGSGGLGLADVISERPLAALRRVNTIATLQATGGGGSVSAEHRLTAHTNRHTLASHVIPASIPDAFFLQLTSVDLTVREPRARAAYRISAECTLGCLAVCLDQASPPASLVSKATAGADDLATLTRFRDEVLSQSAKGREYTAQYQRHSNEAYRAIVTSPSGLLDVVAAQTAWMPAIRSLVESNGSVLISQAMVDRLDLMAQHFILNADPTFAAVIEREYRLLEPRELVGQSISAVRERFEHLPTLKVLRSGFEAGETGEDP
ncbi:MAG: hypothetical protein ACT4NL_13495 [Pseudomarimonas sp.]